MTLDAYADLDTFRLFLRSAAVVQEADDPDSAIESLALESASRLIDTACGRSFKVSSGSATARVFTAYEQNAYLSRLPFTTMYPYINNYHYSLAIDDVADTSGMSIAFDATGNGGYTNIITNYRVGPANAAGKGLPFTKIIFDTGIYPPTFDEGVQVTAKWGWSAVPTTIKNATLIQASRLLKRRDAAFGVAGSPEMGAQLRLLSKLDPDVAVMVAAFDRNWGAV